MIYLIIILLSFILSSYSLHHNFHSSAGYFQFPTYMQLSVYFPIPGNRILCEFKTGIKKINSHQNLYCITLLSFFIDIIFIPQLKFPDCYGLIHVRITNLNGHYRRIHKILPHSVHWSLQEKARKSAPLLCLVYEFYSL